MNIGVTCYPTVGGSGAVAAELGKQLARRGHQIHFISYRLPFRLGDFHENVSFHEVDVSSYVLFEHPPHDLALAAKMAWPPASTGSTCSTSTTRSPTPSPASWQS